jgi:hypothetical protein
MRAIFEIFTPGFLLARTWTCTPSYIPLSAFISTSKPHSLHRKDEDSMLLRNCDYYTVSQPVRLRLEGTKAHSDLWYHKAFTEKYLCIAVKYKSKGKVVPVL